MSKARTGYVRSKEEIEKQKDSDFNRCAVQNLNTGEVFRNSAEAERKYNNGKVNNWILSAIELKKGAYGYFWAQLKNNNGIPYTEEERAIMVKELRDIQLNTYSNPPKLLCIDTGELFESFQDAQDKYGIYYIAGNFVKFKVGGYEWKVIK